MRGFKRVLQLLGAYKFRVGLSLFFNILSTLFGIGSIGVFIPFLNVIFNQEKALKTIPELTFSFESFQAMLNYYIGNMIEENGAGYGLALVGVLVVVTSLFKNLFRYLSNYHLSPVRNGVIRDTRNKLYNKILSLDLSYFSGEKKGNVIARFSHDVNDIESSVMQAIFFMIREPITIIFTITVLIMMSWKLTVFVFILLPVAGLLIGKLGKSLRQVSFNSKTILGNVIASVEETLSGIRVIKAFNAEKLIRNLFVSTNESYTKMMTKVWRKQDMASPISEFLGTTTVALLIWFGGSQVLASVNGTGSGALQPSEFIAYLMFFGTVIAPAKAMSSAYFTVQKGVASFDRIDEVLNAENHIKDPVQPKPISSLKESIQYKDVSFAYNSDKQVIKNLNLTIEKGKTIALVGQSGSGKSTLVDLLPRFYDVTEGTISLDGVNINNFAVHELRQMLGIVNQDPILFNDSIFNNIAFGKEGVTKEAVIEAAKIANAHEFISQLENGYETIIGDRGGKLSGGQRQRISIARAVLSNAEILILDEATSALDTESERLVQDALDKLMQNRTSIVIAHRLSTIVNADEIIVMQEGEIVEQGKHKQLLDKKGTYFKLYTMQSSN